MTDTTPTPTLNARLHPLAGGEPPPLSDRLMRALEAHAAASAADVATCRELANRMADPVVHVLVHDGGSEWVIDISDNGAGISPELVSRLFEPFSRGGGTGSGGSGLGLAIVRALVDGFGGDVRYERAPEGGAQFVVRGPKGDRTIQAADFYQDTFVTALESNEILTEVQIPKARSGQGNAYSKLEKRVGDFPIVGVAANLHLGAKGTIETVGIGLTSVGPTALKATEAEQHLVGKAADDAIFDDAGKLCQGIARPTSDLRGPAEYKAAMVRVLARRALGRARDRARGGA